MKKPEPIKTAACLTAAAALLTISCAALDSRLKTVTYRLQSDKVRTPVRLAVVADLHGCQYGRDMSTLIRAVRKAKPHAILLPGDFIDDRFPEKNSLLFAAAAVSTAPTFYVTGNHEIGSGFSNAMKASLRSLGITVLEGDAAVLTVGESTLWICGADDPWQEEELAASQRKAARNAVSADEFSVLLSHRPEMTEEYRALGFDLVVSGHAHGGQWRLPGLINGIYAPHQGLFPSHAGGRYDLGTTTLIVSRGLARESTPVPRIFNRPELVLVDVCNSKGGRYD